MHSQYFYAAVAFCLVLSFIFMGVLPIVDALCARNGYREAILIERICFTFVLTVIFLALAGIIVSVIPWSYKSLTARLMIIGVFITGFFFCLRRTQVKYFLFPAQKIELLFLGTFIFFATFCLALALGKYKLPNELPDGAYVNKEHVTAVRIQKYTGDLPADNVIPYVASEYLVRGLSFKDNHPILPGQEVTNRPILLSLMTVAIRASLAIPPPISNGLPTFSYVGTSWPDFRVFVRDEIGFSIFLSVAIIFNAGLLLATGAIGIRCFRLSFESALIFCALFISSPYFIFQTLFTWPKALAGFFIICALLALFTYRAFSLVGILLGLAYLSHPFAITYAGIFLLFLLIAPSFGPKRIQTTTRTFLSIALVVLPWFLWSKFVVRLDSDLVSQNFWIPGQQLIDFLWIRVVNLASTIQALYLVHHPFDIKTYVTQASVNAVGALGVIPTLFLLPAATRLGENREALTVILITGLSALLITLIFSIPTVPALHGFQGFLPLALLLAIKYSEQYKRVIRSLLCIQAITNLVMITVYTARLRGLAY